MTAPESKAALGMVDVLAAHAYHGENWCGNGRDWTHKPDAPLRTNADHRAHVAAALSAAGFGDTAAARAEALTEAAKWVIGCEHVSALRWCGICDQWRAALEAEAARIARAESEARRG